MSTEHSILATAQYTFFSAAHGTFSKTDILGTKQVSTNIRKLK
jgi:hypothetical protein